MAKWVTILGYTAMKLAGLGLRGKHVTDFRITQLTMLAILSLHGQQVSYSKFTEQTSQRFMDYLANTLTF